MWFSSLQTSSLPIDNSGKNLSAGSLSQMRSRITHVPSWLSLRPVEGCEEFDFRGGNLSVSFVCLTMGNVLQQTIWRSSKGIARIALNSSDTPQTKNKCSTSNNKMIHWRFRECLGTVWRSESKSRAILSCPSGGQFEITVLESFTTPSQVWGSFGVREVAVKISFSGKRQREWSQSLTEGKPKFGRKRTIKKKSRERILG